MENHVREHGSASVGDRRGMVSDRPHRSLRRGPDTDSRHIRPSRAQPLDLGFGVADA